MRGSNEQQCPRRAVVIMVDLSEQMGEPILYEGQMRRQGEVAIEWVKDLLAELYLHSHSSDSSVARCDVALFGYSGAGVTSLLSAEGEPFITAEGLASRSHKRTWLRIGALSPLDSPDDYEHIKRKICAVEFSGSRPMLTAYRVVLTELKTWIKYTEAEGDITTSPQLININCGEATDSDRATIESITQQICSECRGSDEQAAVVQNITLGVNVVNYNINKNILWRV